MAYCVAVFFNKYASDLHISDACAALEKFQVPLHEDMVRFYGAGDIERPFFVYKAFLRDK